MADPVPNTHYQASTHDPVYDRLHETAEFEELRGRYRGFVFPWTAAFLSWYLLYVVLSNWAPSFMSHKLWGNITVGLVMGLLQFVSTFAITTFYVRYANKNLDPGAKRIRESIEGADR